MATTAPSKSRADSAPNVWRPELHEIPVDAIQAGHNVRADIGDITELADSIERHGLEQPIRVVELGATPENGQAYELVFGHRRLAAAKHLGLKTIPALVEPFASDGRNGIGGRAVRQLIENLQREDLNALDTARAYRQLLDAGLTQRELGEQLGIAQPTIANTLALLKAPDEIQAKVAAGELTRSHVEAIVKLPKAEQAEVARRVVEHKLSTRDVELEVDRAAQRASAADRQRDETRALADAAETSLVKKKGVTKEAARLRFYDRELDAEMRRRGWTTIDQTAGYGKPKGCDCLAFDVSRNYMGSSVNKSVTISGACIDKAHFEAAEKTAEEKRRQRIAKVQAEEKERAAKERAERAKVIAPIVDRLSTDAKLRSRVVLWYLAQESWGPAAEALDETAGGMTWEKLAKLSEAAVDRFALEILADQVLDAPEVTAAVAPAKPKPAKKAKS